MPEEADAPTTLTEDASSQSRRALLGRAAVGVAAMATVGSAAGPALAAKSAGAWDHSHSHFFHERVLDFIITQELFGVTVVSEAVRRAPGTPSEQFLPVLRAAVETEFDHVRALQAVGATPLTSSFWVPDAAFGDVVRIVETRPLSKLKRWRMIEIVEKAK
jgi:Ribosomal protein S17